MQLLIKNEKNEQHFLRKFLKSIPDKFRNPILKRLSEETIQEILIEYPLASLIHRILIDEKIKHWTAKKNLRGRRIPAHRGFYGVRARDIIVYTKEISKVYTNEDYFYRLCKSYILARYYNYVSQLDYIKANSTQEFSYFIKKYLEEGPFKEKSLLQITEQEYSISKIVGCSKSYHKSGMFPQKVVGIKYPLLLEPSPLKINIIKN